MSYKVYKHTSPSGKVYIGVTKRSLSERSGPKGGQYKKSNKYFYEAIQKYGWSSFKHEILLNDLTKEEASEKEQYFINLYHSNDPKYGYNLTSGGEVHFEFNEEIKQKISDKTKAQWQNPEIREKMIVSLKESHSGPLTDAQIEANRRRRGVPLSEECKTKMRGRTPWNKNKKGVFSLEARQRMSVAHKGQKPPNKGVGLSDEQKKLISERTKEGMNNPSVRQKIINSNKNRTGKTYKYLVYQIDLDNILIAIHKGISNASRATGIPKASIANCLYGKTKTAYGYYWRRSYEDK